jgi:hypothetical protein
MEGRGRKSAPSLSAAAKEADGVEWCCGRDCAAVECCLDCAKFGKAVEGMKKNVGAAAVDDSPGWVDRWVAG